MAMEMNDVVFTVPSAVQSVELLAADTHLSTMHLPKELPLSAAEMCMHSYEPTPTDEK